MIILTLAIFLSCFSVSTVFAQEVGDSTSEKKQLYVVTKTDGGEFFGYILSDDGREILLETKNIGKIYISKSDIKEIKAISETEANTNQPKYNDFREQGPFTTRYYLTTNALPIKKGENYAMIHLYGPEVHFAVSNQLSLGVMASWIASPIGLATKYSFKSPNKYHFAVGSIVASSGFLLNSKGFGGLHWGTVTYGNRKSNFSLSAGYGYLNLNNQKRYIGNHFELAASDYAAHYNSYDVYYKTLEKLGVTNNDLYKRYAGSAAAFGIGALTPVGQKSSFIFDGMIFINKKSSTSISRTFTVPNVSYYTRDGNYVTSDVVVNEFEIVQKGLGFTALIMPGMRFHKAFNRSFQVVLAGVVTTAPDGDINTFPVPMISWLRQF
ncbi:MAG: hypothetical protein H6607_08065 [Flavobacteriales bacterium]|nr:hypothetical protein [Flavobacteriales bacterium]